MKMKTPKQSAREEYFWVTTYDSSIPQVVKLDQNGKVFFFTVWHGINWKYMKDVGPDEIHFIRKIRSPK
jgi:hypothetical protein